MSDIDWSKAPAEATHYGPKREDNDMWCAVFWTVVNGIGIKAWQIDNKTGDLTQYSKPTWCPEDLHRLIPRPTVWTGEGLPPVGTVCELHISNDNWQTCEVIAMDAQDGEPVSVVRYGGGYYGASAKDVRPIRSPEQIAAEEREDAILQMRKDGAIGHTMAHYQMCMNLYDAGWRRI